MGSASYSRPATEDIDRTKKLAIYARERVRYAWLVNPMSRTLEILRLEGPRWTVAATHEGHVTVREPFDAIELALGGCGSARRAAETDGRGQSLARRAVPESLAELK
jgi:hypothetical protein